MLNAEGNGFKNAIIFPTAFFKALLLII